MIPPDVTDVFAHKYQIERPRGGAIALGSVAEHGHVRCRAARSVWVWEIRDNDSARSQRALFSRVVVGGVVSDQDVVDPTHDDAG